ncbi:YhcH/YjgK/YiaL family protein [Terrisporobacter sp.]|uniref:YhcH/YjgK/YiaL family protein n=1 Tax=Terrisporobacter sp. TaxID=1965305 RepID=UPI002636C8F2|nr:YhcH/YjgK/YiaL family protein [Terrisporobacter sp.]
MIIDNIKYLEKYLSCEDYTNKIIKFIKKSRDEYLEEGRYSLDGDNLIAIIQKYETKTPNECKFESHMKYIDIQYIERGQEIINWIDISKLIPDGDYNEERDILLYNPNSEAINLNLEEGMFAIFLKHDGHRSRCIMNEKCNVKKILFKIKVNKDKFYK